MSSYFQIITFNMAKRIIAFLYVFCIGFVTSMHEDCDETCYMTKDMTPTPGPEKNTVYYLPTFLT